MNTRCIECVRVIMESDRGNDQKCNSCPKNKPNYWHDDFDVEVLKAEFETDGLITPDMFGNND